MRSSHDNHLLIWHIWEEREQVWNRFQGFNWQSLRIKTLIRRIVWHAWESQTLQLTFQQKVTLFFNWNWILPKWLHLLSAFHPFNGTKVPWTPCIVAAAVARRTVARRATAAPAAAWHAARRREMLRRHPEVQELRGPDERTLPSPGRLSRWRSEFCWVGG